MELSGIKAIVTGGASGLGEACVESLVRSGAKVSIFDTLREKGQEIASTMNGDMIFCETDVTDESNLEASIEKTIKEFGAVHVIVNCAGYGVPAKFIGKKGAISIELINRIIQVNLIGSMNVIRLAAERIIRNTRDNGGERGVIINTASVNAFDGPIGHVAYSASKAGVVGMTLPLAREFAEYGIRVVTIAPGLFDTALIEREVPETAKKILEESILFPSRFGKPSEFARLVLEIIENPMLNGCTIRLDAALRMPAK